MKKITLSVVLATRNEQANLAKCLDSVKDIADEIVVADEQSTDDTVKIAHKYHARVITVSHHDNFHITKNIAIAAAQGDWILQLDADEVVSPQLAREIAAKVRDSEPDINGYWANRRNWFLTRFLTKGGQYPDPTLRLYRQGCGRLPAVDIHEQAVVSGSVGYLNHDLLHYRDTTFEKYLAGFNRYTTFIAGQMAHRHQRLGIWPTFNFLVIKPVWTFVMIFLRHRGYVDGFPGLVFALYSGLVHPVAYIKYWQHTQYPA